MDMKPKSLLKNYEKIVKEPFELEKIRKRIDNGKGICEFDLYILEQYIKTNKIKTTIIATII